MNSPDVWAAIEHAKASPALKADAQRRWAAASQNLFHEHAVELSASSAGKCALETWAYLHDAYTLPENYQTEVCKMDGGTFYGCWVAALFAAGYEDLNPGALVEIELEVEHDGIPGHLDILIRNGGFWVVEVKSTFSTFAFEGPKPYQVIQAAKYALAVGAPSFSVFTLLPAAQKRKGAAAMHHHQADFVTNDYWGPVAAEYGRLKAAEFDTPPQADPDEAWRCTFCRYGACEKNANPAKDNAAAAAMSEVL